MLRSVRACLSLSLLSLAACDEGDVVTGDEQHQDSGPALRFEEYSVLFTNPVCKRYTYGPEQEVVDGEGNAIAAKPVGAWCSKSDAAASAARPESPQSKLVSWIDDEQVNEIFLGYFTMSNAEVTKALCRAIETRDVKVTLVLDKSSDLTRAREVEACRPASGDETRAPRLLLRGGEGNIALHHNKVFLFNPHGDAPRVVFSSGNMTSGVVLHHENWHFISTFGDTYFAQAHRCLIAGLEEHASSKSEYSSFIKSCRAAIEPKEERDIKTFFIPGEGDRAFAAMQKGLVSASAIDVAAHRFSNKGLISNLKKRLEQGTPVRLVVDDDLHWAGEGEIVGGNDANEAKTVADLVSRGVDVRYVETNHVDKLLHHNKFIVFDMPGEQPDAVFAGSANLTGAGFSANFENFYWITIPSVAEAFHEQYTHLFDELGTPEERLPAENLVPAGPVE